MLHLEQRIQKWNKLYLRKAAFEKFEVIWSAQEELFKGCLS